MYLIRISFLVFFVFSSQGFAADRVASWLEQMGCDELLATHLEKKLDQGTSKEQFQAANKLANVYAILLSRAAANEDVALLERANSLLDKMPDAGTTELRLQLLRAAYLSSEQMIERYRLRYTDKAHADAAAEQLISIARKLAHIYQILQSKVNRTGKSTDTLDAQIGLSSSLLGWAYYYISFQLDSTEYATRAGEVFATILQGDKPTLASVSLDLKRHEQGARALLGIALVKELLQDPSGAEPWLEEIDGAAAHPQVRLSIPMWRFFSHINAKRWDRALQSIPKVKQVDRSLLWRLAAVHALEHTSNTNANLLAKTALAELISTGQLAMVSDIVERYGISALDPNSFITYFILADSAYKKTYAKLEKDEPTEEPLLVSDFKGVVKLLEDALASNDSSQYLMLVDDCELLRGFSYYYIQNHEASLDCFIRAKNGDKSETAIWMCLVNLALFDSMTAEQQSLQNDLVALYLSTWPHSRRATQLLLFQAESDNSQVSVDDLLAILPSDPSFEESQRKAARLLYKQWLTVDEEELKELGNKYVSVAVALVREDQSQKDSKQSIQRSAVRALRLLEVSLHKKIKRVVAAKVAFKALSDLEAEGLYSLDTFHLEIKYRAILYSLYSQDYAQATSSLFSMLVDFPTNSWTQTSAQSFWQLWTNKQFPLSLREQYVLGRYLISGHSDAEIASPKLLSVALLVAKAGLKLQLNQTDNEVKEIVSLIRTLHSFHPRVERVLLLAARIESELGESIRAANHWKNIAAASTVASSTWLEAKYNLSLVLSKTNKQHALDVLDQHFALYPEYGVEPYGTLLKTLHDALRGDQ